MARQECPPYLYVRLEKHLSRYKKQMADDTDPDALAAQPAATALIDRALSGQRDGYGVRLELAHPIVGVGAPAGCFVPGAAELLDTRGRTAHSH